MRAIVATAIGVLVVDLDEEAVVEDEAPAALPHAEDVDVSLPLVVAATRHGSTVVAIVDRRPPLLVSHDGGISWRESGAGLPPGRAVAISTETPDLVLFAGEERLFLSHDGGRFWQGLSVELPGITAVAFEEV